MKTQIHNSKNQKNMLLERKHQGKGVYFQRGICKGIEVGDNFESQTAVGIKFKVCEIKVLRDAKGQFKDAEDAKMSYYEAVLVDETYREGVPYGQAVNIG